MTPSRRRFLRNAALGATAAALPFAAWQFLLRKPKDRLGVALVGLGYYSTDLLAPALQQTKNCYLAGIVTGTPAKAERWKKQFKIPEGNIYNYQTFDKIADNPEIDVVYVVLPPSMHAEYSIRAARAGKHVWCEKPMALNVAECESMIRAAADNRVTLAIGYRMQHEPNTRELIRITRDKPFGEVTQVAAAAGYRHTHDNWKLKKAMGGGAMYDMGVYPLNAARYSTQQQEPIGVTAKASTTRPEMFKEVDETMNFQLEFPNGAIASCVTSFGQGLNSLQVNYEKGWVRLEPFQSYSGIQGSTSAGKALNATVPNQQAKQMDDDALAIMQNKPLIVPGEEGLRDIRVVEAIYRSAESGERVAIE